MKLLPQDQQLFQSLHDNHIGSELVSYLERLIADACDSRTWAENEDKTHANKVATTIQKDLIDKIKLRSQPTPPKPFQFK